MVFDLDEFAVGCGLREPENGAVINPRMAGEDPVGLSRFKQNSGQRLHSYSVEFSLAFISGPPRAQRARVRGRTQRAER